MQLILKIGIFLAIMLSSLLGQAQTNADKLYDSLSGEEGVTSLSLSKSVLQPFEIFLDDDTKKVIYKMKQVRFLSYNENKGNKRVEAVSDIISKNLNGKGYFQIEPEDLDCDNCSIEFDDDDDILLFGHGKKKNMDEFHIVVEESNSVLLFSFYGDITVDDLRECGQFTQSTKGIINL